MSRISITGPMLWPDFYLHKIKNNMNCLILHFPQPLYAAMANVILISTKVQSHKLGHKEKQKEAVSSMGTWYYAVQESLVFTASERKS